MGSLALFLYLMGAGLFWAWMTDDGDTKPAYKIRAFIGVVLWPVVLFGVLCFVGIKEFYKKVRSIITKWRSRKSTRKQ